jgi:hypothetical protein
MSEQKVKIPQKVLDDIKTISNTGLTNMFDFNAVQVIANELEMHATVVWMENNKKEWGKVVLGLVEVIE